MQTMSSDLKSKVKEHWEKETCGTRYGSSEERKQWLDEIADARYGLEPYIRNFAQFEDAKGKKVLEIGVGAGVDFLNWIEHGAYATGVDLTEAAIEATRERLEAHDIDAKVYTLRTADAEHLPFRDDEFDTVYSWGVLHHTPQTSRAFEEAFRVLAPGGLLKAMIYHVPSWTGFLLWVQNCLLRGRPLKTQKEAIFHHLESPGTKAFTVKEAHALIASIGFNNVHITTKLCAGDLLQIHPSEKYQSGLYRALWKLYPRRLVKLLGDRFGLELLITAQKPLYVRN